jgi:hypothetical protein
MDDQQGNVIDGTERARQWRRSGSKAAPENRGDGQGRSDAPKSIAASLLVPAEMLEATLVVANEAPVAARAPSRDEEGESPARPPANTEQRVNPFLLPDAAAPSAQAPPGRARIRSSIRSLGSRLSIAIGSGARSASGWFGVRAHRWQAPRRTSLRLWLAATSGATLVVIAAVALQSASPVRSGPAPGSRPAVRQFKRLLGAVADAQIVRRELYWTAARPASEAQKPRMGKQGRRRGGAPTRHLSNTSSATVVAARYVPPAAAGLGAAQTTLSHPAVTSPGTSSAGSGSSGASAASSTSQPAFGVKGTLGPGTSPDS